MNHPKAGRQRRGPGSLHASLPRRLWPVAAALVVAIGSILPVVAQAADPSAEASAAPAASPPGSAPPSPAAPTGPGILGADVLVYRDGFDSAADWIDLGQDENGRTSLEDGSLYMSVRGQDVNYRDWYELSEPAPVLRVEALVEIDDRATTGGGVACGSALGVPRWFIAGVNDADEWYFGRQIEGRFQLLDRGLLMLPIKPSEGAVLVAIECAVAPDEGGDYVAISVDGRPVSVAMGLGRLDIPVGPYSRAGLYVATDSGTGSARFDDMAVHVGTEYARVPVDRDADQTSE
jgi:hypothetical protein